MVVADDIQIKLDKEKHFLNCRNSYEIVPIETNKYQQQEENSSNTNEGSSNFSGSLLDEIRMKKQLKKCETMEETGLDYEKKKKEQEQEETK